MSFNEAYKQMLLGKKIRRPSFKGYWYQNPETGMININIDGEREISYGKLDITIKNCAASDWEVVEE